MGETRNNFKKAMSEMFGFGEDNAPAEQVQAEITPPKEEPIPAAEVKPAAPLGTPNLSPDELKFWNETPFRAPEVEQIDETYISKDTVIRGDIESGSNLRIRGKVAGNIACDHSILLSGKIDGNISAKDALVDGGQVMGNVDMRGNLTIQRDARVRGDLNCSNLDLDSAVNGNLRTLHKTVFHPNAAVVGNIATQSFVVEEGALIEGYISMKEMQKTINRPNTRQNTEHEQKDSE